MRNTGEFNSLVRELRIKKGFTMRQLCSGLCSVATMEAMTSGKWESDKRLQDSILERLGVAEEGCIHMLDYDEYARWEAAHHILHSITFGEIERAERLLEEYRKRYCRDNKLEEQFCLAMYAQLRYIQGCQREELSALYEEALGKTVLEFELGQLGKLALSLKELNLLLEVEYCRGKKERWERYQEVVEYIDKSGLDGVAKAKIYPKAIYHLCRCAVKGNRVTNSEDAQCLLRYCEQGIELLRQSERMYYLWELLEMEGQLVCKVTEELRNKGQQMWAIGMEEQYREKLEWKQALEAIYAEYGVPKETMDYCYLYVMKGVYCINDVIRIRREMLGISRKELCHNVCDVKTLRRLEQGVTKPQKEIVKQLFERLGLSSEFMRMELVTENSEAGRLMQQFRDQINARCWDKTEVLWDRIKGMIPMDIPCNRQVIMNEELLSEWRRGKMDNEGYCMRVREVLELTLPYDAFLKKGEAYLTNEEQTCIVNRMQGIDSTKEEYLTCMHRLEELYEPYIDAGLWETMWNMYEFVISNVGNACRNIGEYDKADTYDWIILEGCLRFRRMGMIHSSIYGRWWNYDMRKSNGISTDREMDDEEEMSKCILFSVMAKDKCGAQFYQKNMEIIHREN